MEVDCGRFEVIDEAQDPLKEKSEIHDKDIQDREDGEDGVLTTLQWQAADRVSGIFDDLEKLLKHLKVFVERLQVRVSAPMRDGSRRIAVKALVEVLKAFELATRAMTRGRISV